MCVSYWVHKGYGCFLEIGVNKWGKHRADVIALNLKGDIVICEVKSCLADYRTDKKWPEYTRYSNRMYFVFPKQLNVEIPDGIGVMIPGANGYLKVVKPAKHRPMDGMDKRNLVMRLAWRAATYSKRNTKRRVRIYL